MSKSLIEHSKSLWEGPEVPSVELLQLGCLQRIALASERAALNHETLLLERDRYEKWYREELSLKTLAERRVIALRGVITKMKKAKAADDAIRAVRQ